MPLCEKKNNRALERKIFSPCFARAEINKRPLSNSGMQAVKAARRKFLASHGYVEPEEEHGKWWLPHVVRDGKIQYGGDFDYEVQRRHMERTR